MVLALLDAGEKIIVLYGLSTGFRAAVKHPAKLVAGDGGDVTLVDAILARHKIDAIAHFAAKIVVPESIDDPWRYYLNNTAKARTLLECAVRAKMSHFIFSSTAADCSHQEAKSDQRVASRETAVFSVLKISARLRFDAGARMRRIWR